MRYALYSVGTAVFTLGALAAINNFAPVSITNLFLNPKKVIEGVQYIQQNEFQKKMKSQQKNAQKIIKENPDSLFNNPSDPFIGSKDAKAVIVKFADYRCHYCSESAKVLSKVLESEEFKGKVKIILKELPVLGPVSEYASANAMLAWKSNPEKYSQLHHKLFATELKTTKEVDAVFASLGLKSSENALKNEEITKELQAVRKLAQDLEITGTPAFIVGNDFVPGFVSEEDLKAKLKTLI